MSKDKQPEIRFPGFTDEWEQRKLGGIGKTYTGLTGKSKEDFGHGDAKFVTYMNVFQNPKATLEQLENVEIDPRQNEVKKGDVFFTTSSETPEEVGMSSVWTHDINNIYLNSFTFAYRPTIKFDLDYLAFMLRSQSVRKKIIFLAQGISRYNISKTKMMDISVPIPVNFGEQQKIGAFFKQLDDTIALHQRKLDLLKETKKGFLQKMFPKNGAKVPEIRFPGFTEDWEQRKFFDNIKNTIDFRGRTPKKLGMDWSVSGYLALSALNVKNGYIDPSVDAHYGNQELYDKWMSGKELYKGQVLFTTEAPMGNVAQVPDNNKYILSQRTIAFELYSDKITDDFLAVLLRSPQSYNKLLSLASGGTAKGVSQKSLSQFIVTLPKDLDEQQKIGSFFKQLDDTIALHQRKLDLLKEMKKGFLQKMFV
ncbi:TPA: restriction endonuclease subunit S [Enterococcus faecium]|uniref:restriction endonuclease subunit S n=1 Tax=Enterococcus faecium TaxID=1352 RepID=UPI0020193F76|nr:restriction endonuclease subunit S [Enterococcus faecium]UQQ80571.1 restriction endonuclease subunit S [Enterococcus faecium]